LTWADHKPRHLLFKKEIRKQNEPVAALEAEDEGGHRLVGRSRLELVVGAVPLAATAALEALRLGTLDGGQLRRVDALLHESLTLGSNLQRMKEQHFITWFFVELL